MTDHAHCADCGHLEQEHSKFGRRRCIVGPCDCPHWEDEFDPNVEMAKPE